MNLLSPVCSEQGDAPNALNASLTEEANFPLCVTTGQVAGLYDAVGSRVTLVCRMFN